MMLVPLLDNIYTVEPKKLSNAWHGHWNYRWHGRSSVYSMDGIRYRREKDGTYIFIDKNGSLGKVDEKTLKILIQK